MNQPKVACLFGSENDRIHAEHLKQTLNRQDFAVDVHYLSAHRTPKELREFCQFNGHHYHAIVGGAGLAAHLAGTISAHTLLPVFGLPLPGAFAGLDSFLSTLQMPKGIPVLTCGMGQDQAIGHVLRRSFFWDDMLAISISSDDAQHELWEKNKHLINELGIELITEDIPSGKFARLAMIDIENHQGAEITAEFYLPVMTQNQNPQLALTLFDITKKMGQGVWIGTNRLDNALLSLCRLKESWRTPRETLLWAYKEGRRK